MDPSTKILIIGSHALMKVIPGISGRGHLDMDIICTSDALVPFVEQMGMNVKTYDVRADGQYATITFEEKGHLFRLEAEIAWPGTTAERALQMTQHHIQRDNDVSYASMDLQLALKLSHRFKKNSPHFLKTMNDVHMLRAVGARVSEPVLAKWLRHRTKETLNYKHPSLMQAKKDFFKDDGILYVWDHDSIHMRSTWTSPPTHISNQRIVKC